MTRAPALLAALVLLPLVATLVAPTAAAAVPSTMSVTVAAPTGPVKPLSGVVALAGEVAYGYVGPTSASTIQPTKVTLTAVGPAWASVTVSPATLYVMLDDAAKNGASATASFSVLVTTLADAPAFTTDNILVRADAAPNGQIDASNAEISVPIQADYVGLIDARVDGPIRQSTPQKTVSFPLVIRNFGNAATKITFEMNSTVGLEGVNPQPITLESRATGGKLSEVTRMIDVQTPFQNGYMNEPGRVTLKLASAYALDPSKRGDTVTVDLMVNTKGFYAPGPEPLLAIAGVAAIALALGRARARRS